VWRAPRAQHAWRLFDAAFTIESESSVGSIVLSGGCFTQEYTHALDSRSLAVGKGVDVQIAVVSVSASAADQSRSLKPDANRFLSTPVLADRLIQGHLATAW
jgi:hypothetical protein